MSYPNRTDVPDLPVALRSQRRVVRIHYRALGNQEREQTLSPTLGATGESVTPEVGNTLATSGALPEVVLWDSKRLVLADKFRGRR